MRELRGDLLQDWMQAVQADDLPARHTLLTGLRRDRAAVVNGLTLPWNSGACEDAVNRIKVLKRAMDGRANFDLLRRRVLLPSVFGISFGSPPEIEAAWPGGYWELRGVAIRKGLHQARVRGTALGRHGHTPAPDCRPVTRLPASSAATPPPRPRHPSPGPDHDHPPPRGQIAALRKIVVPVTASWPL
jgi:hypothetical protein